MQAPDELAGWPVGQASAGALHRAGPAGPVEQLFVAGPAERTFPWASISKLCTALAFLVAMEEGTVHPHDAAGPPDSTVAHLLAHASGLGPAGEVLAPPGTRRIYSNEGFEVLSR